MPLLSSLEGPIYFRLGVVERGGAVHGETIYYAGVSPHVVEYVDRYDANTNSMTKFSIAKVRVIAVGKTVPYGIVLFNVPYHTACVISGDGDDEYYECDVVPRLQAAVGYDVRHLDKCDNERMFRRQVDDFLKKAEAFFDERPSRPLADGN